MIHDYDNYLPSQTEGFSDGFIHVELFWEDCSEQLDFPGLSNSEAFEYGMKFHKVATKEKENVDPARQTRTKKRKADPSRYEIVFNSFLMATGLP